MNADGSDPVRLTTSGFIQKAAWSPDGSKIAYSTTDGLFIMDPDGTNKIEVLCQSNHIATFDQSWSSDGLKIAYSLSSAVIGDTTGIYAVRIDGSSCSHLTTMLASAPQWRP
jgi:Tol biopolymer transport system component